MSTAVKLDMIPSKDISDYAEKVLLNNPFENFKIENYKYAQLHKSITSNVSLDEFEADLSSISSVKNIKLSDTSDIDLLSDLNKWNFNNADSYFRVNSIFKASGVEVIYELRILALFSSIILEILLML